MAHLTPHRTPSSVFHSPLYRRRKKGAWGYSVATTVPPPHRKYFCPGTHPTASKPAGSLGYKVVCGYNTIVNRGGILGQNMLRHISPLSEPPAVFFTPLSCYIGGKGAWGYTRRMYPRPTKNIFVPGPTQPRPKQPVVWGTGKKVVYGYSSIQRGDSGTKYVRALLLTPYRTPSSVFHSPLCKLGPSHPSPNPPAVFSTPLSAS